MNTPAQAPTEELSPIKRALIEIRELRSRLAAAEGAAREPIAILGAGARLPGGVRDMASLWALLREGRDAISPIPADRWDLEALYDADVDAPGRMITRHGGFIEEVDRFDAEFFGISPREAETLDPQHRIILETAWHALEDAGISPAALQGSATGVFIGRCYSDYERMLFAHRERIDPYFAIGTAGSVLSGRLSYLLGLQGPSVVVDTACSSSLVALHLAMASLRSGECDLAIAGGVSLILSPEININFSKARMMAPDGRCKTFDAAADGYVRGEGCGLVVLRRQRDSAPRDRIRAVLRGSAINQDGRSSGLTAPNGPAQEKVIARALEAAAVAANEVGYVEAHGTGTPLGDPIEVQALAATLCAARDPSAPLAIGSIKTNIGHLEAAAGIAGVLKVMLAMEHGEIPAHLHLHERSPHIDWASHPLIVPTAPTPWAPVGGRRIAGVSSFGFSGTNAHVIVEEAPARPPAAPAVERPLHLLALAARDPVALAAQARAFATALETPDASWPDVAHTANTGRATFKHRLSVVAASREQAARALAIAASGGEAPGLVLGAVTTRPRIAFLFTGGGAQSVGMARSLYDHAPAFRRALDEAGAILEPLMGRGLRDVIDTPCDLDAPIHQTRFGQPALLAVEIALAALWRSWGIVPDAVLGHSLGEYAAAHVAGILSLEDALRIVVARTRAVDALPGEGAMSTIFASPQAVESHLAATASPATVAAYNGPEQVVVSGPAAAVDSVAAHFERQGVRVAKLRVAYASHSAMMDPALGPFERAIAGVTFREPRVAFVSNATGEVAGLADVGRTAYWRDHLRRPVRFAQSIEALATAGITHHLEIGPHPVLVGLGAECRGGEGAWLASLRRKEDDWSVMLEALQHLHAAGAEVDWAGFDAPYARRVVSAPGYPFQRKRHFADWARGPAPVADDPSRSRVAVAAALATQAERAPIGVDLSGYDGKWEALARVATALAVKTLREAGLFARAGERADAEQVRRRLGAAEPYRHLLQRWLESLAAAGLLRREGGDFLAETPLAVPDLAAAWVQAERLMPDNRPLLDYMRHCGSLLGGVMRGEQSPLETLFPGGDFALADGLYRRSATMRYMNDLAASAVAAFAAARGGPIRVLEVGAGTGGTTAALLPQLPAERTRYAYTDVSGFFFERARAEFGPAHPFLRFAELDIDRDPASQRFAVGEFDLVVSSNAIHASRDLRAALRHLRALLAPGGMLLLVESTRHHAWFDVTTGLIEGWQHFADDLRTDNPLLPAATWLEALAAAGFEAPVAAPHDASPAAAVGQRVLVAHVPGRTAVAAGLGEPRADATPVSPGAIAAAAPGDGLRERLAECLPDERADLLRDFVRERVTRVLRLDSSQPPGRHDRLMDLGFDSLMAVQLRNQLGKALGLDKPLPATLLFDHPTIDALAAFLLARTAPTTAPAAPASGGPTVSAAPGVLDATAVAAMSDAEIEALLAQRLKNP